MRWHRKKCTLFYLNKSQQTFQKNTFICDLRNKFVLFILFKQIVNFSKKYFYLWLKKKIYTFHLAAKITFLFSILLPPLVFLHLFYLVDYKNMKLIFSLIRYCGKQFTKYAPNNLKNRKRTNIWKLFFLPWQYAKKKTFS